MLVFAPIVLAAVAGRVGVGVLGDALGEGLASFVAPRSRHVKEIYGVPLAEPHEGVTHELGPAVPESHPLAPGVGAHAAPRTRGVHVPASVVLAFAKRGAVPARDGADGVVLRGVGTGSGLEDGDVVVRVGSAPVRSLREISGIVSTMVLAGYTQVSGAVRRGDQEIPVTVEIPTGAPEPDGGAISPAN